MKMSWVFKEVKRIKIQIAFPLECKYRYITGILTISRIRLVEECSK